MKKTFTRGKPAKEPAPGGRVLLSVRDTGPGIAEPERIFDPFYTTKPKGLGMGLAISRSIIESHGGRLWAEPGAEAGMRFHFTLPAAGEEQCHGS